MGSYSYDCTLYIEVTRIIYEASSQFIILCLLGRLKPIQKKTKYAVGTAISIFAEVPAEHLFQL